MSQIKLKGLAPNSVNSSKVVDGSVSTADIGADQVTGAKIRLANNEELRARNQADSADVNLLKLDTADVLLVLRDFGLSTAAGIANIENNTATYAMNLRSINTNAASTNSGAVQLLSGNAAGATSNSGDIVLQTGTATQTRGDVDIIGREVTMTSNNGADIIMTSNNDFVVSAILADLGACERLLLPFASSDPTGVTEGELYYNTTSNKVRYFDGAVWADVGSTAAVDFAVETIVLSAGDITNQFVDAGFAAVADSVDFKVDGLGPCLEGASYDYTTSPTGGSGGVLRVSLATRLGSGGSAELVAGDIVQIRYLKA